MKLHDLKSPEGSTHRKKIVGRGIGGKGGKTAGRGTKGQKARRQIPAGFEGGQLPLLQRIPKLKGFTNPFRVEYTPSTSTHSSPSGSVTSRSTCSSSGASHERRTSSRSSVVDRSARRSTSRRTRSPRQPRPPSKRPAARRPCSTCPSRCVHQRRATNTRTAKD